MISLLLSLIVAYSVWQSPYSDGSQMVYIGAMLNAVAIVSNGFQMPVFAPELTQKKIDKHDIFHRHKLGDKKTNFKLLCDWIDFDFAVFSPGDLLMLFGTFYNFTGFQLVSNGQNLALKYEFRF